MWENAEVFFTVFHSEEFCFACANRTHLWSKTGIGFLALSSHLTFKDNICERPWQPRTRVGSGISPPPPPSSSLSSLSPWPSNTHGCLLRWNTQYISEGVIYFECFPSTQSSFIWHPSCFETYETSDFHMWSIKKEEKLKIQGDHVWF